MFYRGTLGRKQTTIFSTSAIYLLSNIVNAVMPLALIPVLTRYLLPSEYGEVAIFQTLLGALGALVGLNAVGAAGRKYYEGTEGGAELPKFNGSC